MKQKQLADLMRDARDKANAERKGKGMSIFTQTDVAKALKVSLKTVSEWESGKAQPKALALIEYCQFFGMTVDEMLGVKKNAFCSI